MKLHKTDTKASLSDLTNRVITNLPWSEIQDLLKDQEYFKDEVEKVSDDVYRFVALESNHPVVLKSILKHLQESDPGSATLEKATNIANAMMNFAKLRVSELEALRNKKK